MNAGRLSGSTRWVDLVAWSWMLAGVVWLAVLLLRVGYPYHLEWLESHVFAQSLRFAEGHSLYEDPAVGLPSHPYGPLYYLLCGGLLAWTGPSLLPCRAISQVATLFIACAVGALARRSGAPRRMAWLAPCAWFAFFPACGAWLDLARVDLLGLALWVGGLWLVQDAARLERRWWGAITLFTLAALAKQSCLPIAVCAWIWRARASDVRGSLLGAAITLVSTIGAYFAIDALLDGLLLYYAWELPASHAQELQHAALLFVGPALPLCLVGAAALALAGKSRASRHWTPLWVVCALVCTWTVTKQGAYLNHYLPLAVLGAILLPLLCHELRSAAIATVPRALAGTLLIAGAILSLGISPPMDQIPTAEDRASGDAWVAWLRASEVEVRMPGFTYLPVLAGKPLRVHEMAALEVFDDWAKRLAEREGTTAAAQKMAEHPDLRALLRGEPTAIALASDPNGGPGLSFFAAFVAPEHGARLALRWPYPSPATFRARTGLAVRPETVWIVPGSASLALPPLPR